MQAIIIEREIKSRMAQKERVFISKPHFIELNFGQNISKPKQRSSQTTAERRLTIEFPIAGLSRALVR
jgi:hypothetical protein